jgi:hypothetical protein
MFARKIDDDVAVDRRATGYGPLAGCRQLGAGRVEQMNNKYQYACLPWFGSYESFRI